MFDSLGHREVSSPIPGAGVVVSVVFVELILCSK